MSNNNISLENIENFKSFLDTELRAKCLKEFGEEFYQEVFLPAKLRLSMHLDAALEERYEELEEEGVFISGLANPDQYDEDMQG